MEQLGIDGQLLVTQLINFGIMMAILAKFLYKPILKMIHDRQKRIAEGLTLAANMEAEREKLKALHAKTVREAEIEAQKIINAAKKEAIVIKEAIIAKGHEELVVLKQRQEQDTANSRKQLERSLTDQTVDVAQKMVRQLLGNILNEKQHRQLIELQLTRIMKHYEKSARS